MKILLSTYIYHPSVGGTETIVADLAGFFVGAGHDVTVACAHDPHRREMMYRGARIVEFPYRGIMAEGSHSGDIEEYREHIKREQYDIAFIICEPIHWCLYGAPFDARTRLVAVPCINEETVWRFRHLPTVEQQTAYYLRHTDAVIAMTSEGPDAKFLRSQNIPFTCIPNAVPEIVPTKNFFSSRGMPADRPIILHPANFSPVKNHVLTLDLARRLSGRARIVMMGNVIDHAEYATNIERLACAEENVTILHNCSREDVAGAMRESALMILPSHAEGAPLALIEAMAAGLPFVASDRIGSRADVRGGVITPLENFIATVETLLDDRARRETLGAEGREVFQKTFHFENFAARYLDVAHRVLQPHPKASWQNISFCIITNGKRPSTTKKVIESIKRQAIATYEIIIAGKWEEQSAGVTVVAMQEEAERGEVSAMRNKACARAQYDTVCWLDDDAILDDGWYDGLMRFGPDFDVLCSRLRNVDGTRCWDWTCNGGPRGHTLLEEWDDDWYVYPTGACVVMRREVWQRVKWNESLHHGEAEENEYARRLKQEGFRIAFNPHSGVLHADARYTQDETIVITVEGIDRDASAEEAKAFHARKSRRTLEQRVSKKIKKTWGKILGNRPKQDLRERRRAYNEIKKLLLVQTGSLAETLAAMMVVRRLAEYNPGMKIGFLGPPEQGKILEGIDTVTTYSTRLPSLPFSLRECRDENYDVVMHSSFDRLEYGATLSRLASREGYTIAHGAARYGWFFDHLEKMVITARDKSHTAKIFSFVLARALCAEGINFLPHLRFSKNLSAVPKYEIIVDGEEVLNDDIERYLNDAYGSSRNNYRGDTSRGEWLSMILSARRVCTNRAETSLLCSSLDIPCVIVSTLPASANRWYPLSRHAACILQHDASLSAMSKNIFTQAIDHLDSPSEELLVLKDPAFACTDQELDRLICDITKDRREIVASV